MVRTVRKKIWFLAASLLFTGMFIAPGCTPAQAQSGITAAQGRRLTCASDDGRRHVCRVDTSRGVRMLKQRSGSACIQGSTWGFDRRGIWVDRGCRADFEIGINRPPRPASTITCSSNNGRRQYCSADTSRGVRMVRQRSGSACVQNSTWGYDRRGIWVDRGCRADFALGGRR